MSRALISVYDKSGVCEFARGLNELGYELVSTGGTYQHLRQAGLPVTYVSEVTGFPEILDGRVKTLHPNIHAGLLARRDVPEHMKELSAQKIVPIDVVVSNLYPFAETIKRPGVTFAEAIENIDIGGPAMIRAAAKNHAAVVVVVAPAQYDTVLAELRQGELSMKRRQALAQAAFAHTAAYDTMVQKYLAGSSDEFPPANFNLDLQLKQSLRYGENPHQKAAFYRDLNEHDDANLACAHQLQGKELSYNNISDTAAALEMIREFTEPAVVAVKHANPCGLAVGASVLEAYQKAYEADPVSIFGGIIACNREVDADCAQAMSKVFLEVVIAPGFTPQALEILGKKVNLRLLQVPVKSPQPWWDMKRVRGGLLVQEADALDLDPTALKVVTDREPTAAEWEDLRFAWRVVKHVKSNAIVLAKNGQTIGVGAGQMSRILSARIAIEQAGAKTEGSALGSDAFFPFDDVVKAAAAAKVSCIIQPGGSKRDAESVAAANAAGLTMVFTGIRHFKH